MKPIIIICGLGIGILIGIFPSLTGKKPFWWKLLLTLFIAATAAFALIPITASPPSYARFLAENNITEPVRIRFQFEDPLEFPQNSGTINFGGVMIETDKELIKKIEGETDFILQLKYNKEQKAYTAIDAPIIDPLLTFPFIVQLQDRIKIMNFHVPSAWIAVLAYLVSMIYAVMYLYKKDYRHDVIAYSSAGLGLLFTILATVTGMIWAKYNWGTYWNWDPRQTSILVLMLIYGAYFALRNAISNYEQRARLSSVYAILAFITVPFFIFILPRITTGLHPGSADDISSGPVMGGGSMLDQSMLLAFGLALAAFTMLYFWMLNLKIRMEYIKNSLN